jgi:hypothetical protein
MRPRLVVALLLLSPFAPGQEEEAAPSEPSPYAAMGFPVTFNGEIITPNDVARFLDQPLETLDAISLRRSRDILISRKINARIAADLGIVVSDRDVEFQLKREIDLQGGDAKFYEWLAQQGKTLERYRFERREWIIDQLLKGLIASGVSADRMQLLPWRVAPTPKEVEAAIRNDPGRRADTLRARRLTFTVEADKALRDSLVLRQAMLTITAEEVDAALEANVKPKVEAAVAALKRRPFADVAREHGAKDVEAMANEWVALTGATAAERFLMTADVGAWSDPLRRSGGYEIVQLLARSDPSERKATDPLVADEYHRRIRALRMTKCEALLRRQALDASLVEPERVRSEIRRQILDSLQEAEDGLRALGLR